jgi:hypothetical protein
MSFITLIDYRKYKEENEEYKEYDEENEENRLLEEMRSYITSSIPHELDSPNTYNNSEWNEKISFQTIKECCDRIFSFTTPIISLGSGNGKLENYLYSNGYSNILCIEPEIFSHNKEQIIYKKPDFNYVDEVISKKPDIIGNCSLMIIWPYNNSSYDIESIQKLKPKNILILYESNGYSGSKELLKFANNPGPEWLSYELINVEHFRPSFPLNYVLKIFQHFST